MRGNPSHLPCDWNARVVGIDGVRWEFQAVKPAEYEVIEQYRSVAHLSLRVVRYPVVVQLVNWLVVNKSMRDPLRDIRDTHGLVVTNQRYSDKLCGRVKGLLMDRPEWLDLHQDLLLERRLRYVSGHDGCCRC